MSTSNSTVQYRDVPGFPGYRVGDDGSVWSCKKLAGRRRGILTTAWKPLKPVADSHGRLFVKIERSQYIHHLVLNAFVGPRPEGCFGCHCDDDPNNNHLGNLRWDTRKGNAADAIRNGRQIRGERCHYAKLTAGKVVAIREEYASGGTTFAALGRKYGIAPNNIRLLIKRRTWAHIP